MKIKKIEFSKLIMVGVMLTYFIALFFLMWVISRLIDISSTSIGTAITAFCTFVAAPVATAVGFYSWKAKNDNAVKIPYLMQQGNGSDNDMPVNEKDGL